MDMQTLSDKSFLFQLAVRGSRNEITSLQLIYKQPSVFIYVIVSSIFLVLMVLCL